ncbi:MAG TPA: DUF2207 domain-containing protein [Candidatus Limnocylindrales bacterium]|nr:DUF2207 domain-containing protein [Candidatus Limnocylindrales bacterium]
MKIAARLALVAACLGAGVMAAAAPAHADEGWVITSFASTISIASDSSLNIREDIRVDFGSQQKHGIFRTIPLRYRYDNTRDRYYELTVNSVTDGSRSLPYTTSVQSDNEVIKIGDPNVLVSGTNRYVIVYQVVGAMNAFPDHDELFWNVDGALWPVPKQTVIATVVFPSGSFQKAACYEGPTGSTETCAFENSASTATYTSKRQLGSGEQMSVVVGLVKGAVTVPPPLLEARRRQFPQDAFDVNPLTVGVSLLVMLAGIGLIARFWWLHGRDRAYLTQYYLTNDPRDAPEAPFRHEPVVVEFEPPQKMRPAQLGLILDESADTKDVTATIVDLAVRGFLTISEVAGKHDWMLTRKGRDVAGLLPYEMTLLDGLFVGGRQQVKVSELKGTFQSTLRSAESQVYSDAMSRKLFRFRPDYLRGIAIAVAIVVILAGAGLTFILGLLFGWGLVGLAVILTGLVLLVVHRALSTRTAPGRDLMQHTLGFRLYMNTAEKYRQQFAEKAEIFTQLLPYAIVFGSVSRWAKAFEGIDTSATNSWYVGQGPFQAALLSSSLESMNASLSSAIASSPPSSGSSSGFGGGGFSGGGGGGGGGGSW